MMAAESDGLRFDDALRHRMIGLFGSFERFHSRISSATSNGFCNLHGVVQMNTSPLPVQQREESRSSSPTTVMMLQSMQNLVDRSPLHPPVAPSVSRKDVIGSEPGSSFSRMQPPENDENSRKSFKRRRSRERVSSSERERKKRNHGDTDDDTETSRDSVSVRVAVKREDMDSLFGPDMEKKEPPDKGTPDSGVLCPQNGGSLTTEMIIDILTKLSPLLSPPRFGHDRDTLDESMIDGYLSPPGNPSMFIAQPRDVQDNGRREAVTLDKRMKEDRKEKKRIEAEKERKKKEYEQEEAERREREERDRLNAEEKEREEQVRRRKDEEERLERERREEEEIVESIRKDRERKDRERYAQEKREEEERREKEEQQRKEKEERDRKEQEEKEERERKEREDRERQEREELERKEERRRKEKEERERERKEREDRVRKEKDERERKEKEERERKEKEDQERKEKEEQERIEREERERKEMEERERKEKEDQERKEEERKRRQMAEIERKETEEKIKKEAADVKKREHEKAREKEEIRKAEKLKRKVEREKEKERIPCVEPNTCQGALDLSRLDAALLDRLRSLGPSPAAPGDPPGSIPLPTSSAVSAPTTPTDECETQHQAAKAIEENGVVDMDIAESSSEKDKEEEERERRKKEKEIRRKRKEKEKLEQEKELKEKASLEREKHQKEKEKRKDEKDRLRENTEKDKDKKDKDKLKVSSRELSIPSPVPKIAKVGASGTESDSEVARIKHNNKHLNGVSTSTKRDKEKERFRETASSSPVPRVVVQERSSVPATPKQKAASGRVSVRTESPLPPTASSSPFQCASKHCFPKECVSAEQAPPGPGSSTDFYHKRAKDYKHQADQEVSNKVERQLLYFESVAYFVRSLSTTMSEDQRWSVLKDTNDLLKFVTSNFLRSSSLNALAQHFRSRIRDLSQRTQAILLYNLFHLRSSRTMKNMKIVDQLAKQVEELKSTDERSPSTNGQGASTDALSPGSSHAGSSGMAPQTEKVTMPKMLYNLHKQQLKTLSHLMMAHKTWDDVKAEAGPSEQAFVTKLESICGPLSVDMPLDSLVGLVLTAVAWLRAEFAMERSRPPPAASANPPSASSQATPSKATPSNRRS